jgi:hypothetical protein
MISKELQSRRFRCRFSKRRSNSRPEDEKHHLQFARRLSGRDHTRAARVAAAAVALTLASAVDRLREPANLMLAGADRGSASLLVCSDRASRGRMGRCAAGREPADRRGSARRPAPSLPSGSLRF